MSSTGPARRIQRASRACEICHSRKVRCDASTLGVPCTNCQAFGFDCKIPTVGRRRKTKSEDTGNDSGNFQDDSESPVDATSQTGGETANESVPPESMELAVAQGAPTSNKAPGEVPTSGKLDKSKIYVEFLDNDLSQTSIPDNGRVAYLGESSNLSFIIRRHAADDADKEIYHYPIPDVFRESTTMKLSVLDADEVEALKNRGAFLLPPKDVCDDLIDTYFTKIAPQIPVINRTVFMKQYRNVTDPPPLLLLQVIFLAASRVSKNPALVDRETGSTNNASMTFWKRAKALYDADYEDDKVVIIQSLLLLSWWWEGPEDVTRNVWYWIGTAIRVAQGIGMHRSVAKSKMSVVQKRTWKRVWWTCFAQDRRVAVALGRPMCINLEDSDMEMLTEEDFIEEELLPGMTLQYPYVRNHVLYFIQSVKLTEIMGVVLSRQYSAASRKAQQYQSLDLTHSDMALANWLMSLPPEMQYHCSKGFQEQNFWAAFLHMTYYTVLCLLHRPHLKAPVRSDNAPQSYPSRNIAFTAANMITRILEDIVHYGNLEILPSFSTYAIFSAMIFHSFEVRSPNPIMVDAARKKLAFCKDSLIELSKVWLVATSIVTLFDAIAESKTLQDRLTKASIQPTESNSSPMAQESRKRRAIDSMFESRRLSINSRFEANSPVLEPPSVNKLKKDAVLGGWVDNAAWARSKSSQVGRIGTPVAQGDSQSASIGRALPSGTQTPPDFFFSTEQNIPHTFWENYQPDFLFPQEPYTGRGQRPQDTNPQESPCYPGASHSPASSMGPRQQDQSIPPSPAGQGTNPSRNAMLGDYMNPGSSFTFEGMDFAVQNESLPHSETDPTNDGGRTVPPPESLNVAEWYSFLGLHGDQG